MCACACVRVHEMPSTAPLIHPKVVGNGLHVTLNRITLSLSCSTKECSASGCALCELKIFCNYAEMTNFKSDFNLKLLCSRVNDLTLLMEQLFLQL